MVEVAAANAPGRYPDGDGLYLVVSKAGTKSWVLRFWWQGKVKDMGLGSAREIRLAEARAVANDARVMIKSGRNPIVERRVGGLQRTETPNFLTYAKAYIASVEGQWRNEKHRAQWHMTIEVYAKPLHELKISDVDTSHVYEVLRPIWIKKAETAIRLRGRIEKILDAAKAAKLRSGDNPARWRGHLEHLLQRRSKLTRKHHAAMPYEDVPAFVKALRARPEPSANALEFHILTAARPGMVENMRLEHIDWVNQLWIVPAGYMKMGVEHVVPLTDRALQILRDQKHTARKGYVFWGRRRGGKISNSTLKALMTRMGEGGFTPHGFRSSFRDWAGDETKHEEETTEHALAHQVGSETRRAYRRRTALKKRRKLLEDWSAYLND